MNVVVLGLALTVGAPAIKDAPPKKDAGIYGEWVVQTMSKGGKQLPPAELTYEFTPEGQWLICRLGRAAKSHTGDIKFDPKTNPSTIDVIDPPPAAGAPPRAGAAAPQGMLGIYRIDGDTLTLCFSPWGGDRPTSFESQDGARTMVMVLKRAKK